MTLSISLVVGAVLVLASAQERRDTASNINNRLSLAKTVGDAIVAKNFTNALGDLAKAVTPLLGIAGPLVQFILGFLGNKSQQNSKLLNSLPKTSMPALIK